MKKITRIVPLCLSVFFVLLIAFPAWVYWRYQYLFYNKYDGDITPELTQWIERFWGSAPALLGYVVPVLLLLMEHTLYLLLLVVNQFQSQVVLQT